VVDGGDPGPEVRPGGTAPVLPDDRPSRSARPDSRREGPRPRGGGGPARRGSPRVVARRARCPRPLVAELGGPPPPRATRAADPHALQGAGEPDPPGPVPFALLSRGRGRAALAG